MFVRSLEKFRWPLIVWSPPTISTWPLAAMTDCPTQKTSVFVVCGITVCAAVPVPCFGFQTS